MLHALDLTRSFQAAKTPWQAVSKNDNGAIECAAHGFAKAALQDTLAALPIVTYEAGEIVIADGSRTGRLLILKNGTVTILKDDKEIAKVAEPGAVFGELSVLLDQPHTAEVRALETSQFHIADATALLSQNPTAVLYVATVLAQRLHVANHALIQLKSQLQTGEPHNVVAKTVSRISKSSPAVASQPCLCRIPIRSVCLIEKLSFCCGAGQTPVGPRPDAGRHCCPARVVRQESRVDLAPIEPTLKKSGPT